MCLFLSSTLAGCLSLFAPENARISAGEPCGPGLDGPCHAVHHARLDSVGGLFVEVTQVSGLDVHTDPLLTLEPPFWPDPEPREPSFTNLSGAKRDTTVLVTLRDTLEMPHFPEADFSIGIHEAYNQARIREADTLVETILSARQTDRDAVLKTLTAFPDSVRIDEQFWLINAFVLNLPRSSLPKLVAHPWVRYVDQVVETAPPLSAAAMTALVDTIRAGIRRLSDSANTAYPTEATVAAARQLMHSDAYVDTGLLAGGWAGLLDTGVNSSHVLFNTPTTLRHRGDCVHGGDTCLEKTDRFDPGEACGSDPHATSSAAILAGNGNMGDAYRGVAGVTLDSWRVMECVGDEGGLPFANVHNLGTVRGFQAAVRKLNKVLLTEGMGTAYEINLGAAPDSSGKPPPLYTYHHGIMSHAANRAFDAGVSVISIMGDSGGGVTQPGDAHRAIGVGAADVITGKPVPDLGFGPVNGRIKPEVLGPTNTYTASGLSSVYLQEHRYTSGAAPYVAGAASLLRNWLKLTSSADTTGWQQRAVPPGQVYSSIILSGSAAAPHLSDTTGAGLLRLPALSGDSFWGEISMHKTGTVWNIPLSNMDTTHTELNAALWWPESFGGYHNVITLELVDADGTVRASSTHPGSVFQKARTSAAAPLSGWTLRIHGQRLGPYPVTVYWSAHAGH